ncbi:hypothetical protein TNCV_4173961 [Trichonephila clavipes]|nr:hypothetical protein TNCV_4173961 [Trichonephila clavipes]
MLVVSREFVATDIETQMSSRWWDVEVRREGASSGVVLVTWPMVKIMKSVTNIPRVAFATIDSRPVASGQGDRSILHSATTFDLLSVHAVPTMLRFCVGVAHYAISCGRYVFRYHLPSLTLLASIV